MPARDGAGSGSPQLLAPVALLFNAFVWGVSWWPLRQLDAAGLHGLWTTTLVYVVATAIISAWRPAAWAEVLRNRGLWLLALASGLANATFNWGVTVGEVVRVVLLFYLMPVWAALLARVVLRERLTVAAVSRIALALAGAAIVLDPGDGGWPVPSSAGDWLGLTGGLAFALANVVLRHESHRPDSARALAMFIGGILMPATIAAGMSAAGSIGWPPPAQPGWIAGTALLALVFLGGNLALQYGAARLPATVTAVVLITEVLFASVSAAWLGDEVLTARKLLGGGLILAAALLAALRPSRRPAQEPSAMARSATRARR